MRRRVVIRRGRTAACVLAWMMGATVLRTAAAQPPPAPAADDAERQRKEPYAQGAELANAGHRAEAADKLTRVLAIRSSPKVRFSLAQAEEHLGQLATAYEDYQRSLADGQAAGENDVVQAAKDASSALEPRVLRLVVTGAPGPAATVDDKPVGLGEPLRLNPGVHRLVVQAPGAWTASSTITLGEGQHADLPVALEAEAPSPPPVAGPPATQPEGAPADECGLSP